MTRGFKSALCSVCLLFLPPGAVFAQSNDLTPIITYDQDHPLLNLPNVFPMVEVYSSGAVVVNRSPVMKNPGRYELQLTAEQLDAMITLAERAELQQFSSESLEAADSRDSELRYIADRTTSTFEFNRVDGQSVLSLGDGTTTDATQTIVLDDVVFTAEAFPESAPMDALKELHVQLLQLFSEAGESDQPGGDSD